MASIKLHINKELCGMRVDRCMRLSFAGIPQSLIERIVRKGLITINGNKALSKTRVNFGQVLDINHALKTIERPKGGIEPPRRLIDSLLESIIFEDDHIMVINKPADLSTQGGSFVSHSVDSVLRHIGMQRGVEYRLTHRIDRHTTGILVIAKTRQAATYISGAFKQRKIDKEYLALVWGVPSRSRIEAPVYAKTNGNIGTMAITNYKVIFSCGQLFSIVRLHPQTGHKHQLRIHMANTGTPILGDDKYGDHVLDKQHGVKDLYLHARAIAIPGYKRIAADIPTHFAKLLDKYNMAELLA